MRENQSDIAALQAGLKARKPSRDGLRLYTADFDSVSLDGFYRGRSAFLILSGPSLTQIDLAALNKRGIVTMAVNNAWAVYRPTLWTCVEPGCPTWLRPRPDRVITPVTVDPSELITTLPAYSSVPLPASAADPIRMVVFSVALTGPV